MNTICHTVCSQLGVRFLADHNSWNVNGQQTSKLWGKCSEYGVS